MSPEGIAAAQRRIEFTLAERRRVLVEAVRNKREEAGAHGASYSSAYVLAVHRICSEEFETRAQLAWAVIREVVDNEGWVPTEDNLDQFRRVLSEALTTGSSDVEDGYNKATSRMNGPWPTLDEPRDQALEKALADAEIDRLGRKARRMPLADELSPPRYDAAKVHWNKATDFAASSPPDYPNAIKEAVTAVESLAQVVIGKTGLTLGDAVKELRSLQRLPAGADKVLGGLWAFANATPGARHGATTSPSADERDWQFAQQISEAGSRLLLDIDAS